MFEKKFLRENLIVKGASLIAAVKDFSLNLRKELNANNIPREEY